MQQAATLQRPFTSGAPRTGSSVVRRQQRCRAAAPLRVAAELAEGSRVKVTAPVKVYHVGKYKEGLQLQGLEGTVVQPNVCDYRHHDGQQHSLSATLPVKVQFSVPAPDGGKDVKVLAHLAENELEAV